MCRGVTPVGLRPPSVTPRHRKDVRINRQGIQLSEPKRCSEKPSHLSLVTITSLTGSSGALMRA